MAEVEDRAARVVDVDDDGGLAVEGQAAEGRVHGEEGGCDGWSEIEKGWLERNCSGGR